MQSNSHASQTSSTCSITAALLTTLQFAASCSGTASTFGLHQTLERLHLTTQTPFLTNTAVVSEQHLRWRNAHVHQSHTTCFIPVCFDVSLIPNRSHMKFTTVCKKKQ
jgi:hypothetical protein